MAKLLIEALNIHVRYGERTVLDIDRLSVYEGDRIGLIGENGAGKSTLLAVLSGTQRPDEGQVRRFSPVAMIRQSGDTEEDFDRRWSAEFRAPKAHEGLSGGEQTRRRIAGALSRSAPLLLADEPTTDLDTSGVARLQVRLADYEGALLLVSHDRGLLRALCNRIWHLEDGHIADFPGGFDDYQAELARRRERQQFEYDQYRAESARLRAAARRQAEWASSVKKAPRRMGNSEARLHTREYTNAVLGLSHAKKVLQNRMEHLEVKERPRDLPDIRMALGAQHPIQAKTALEVRCTKLTANRRPLLKGAAFTLPTGSRTALVGDNGCGKTTLLRAVMGALPEGARFEGEVRFNPAARVGWFDQDHGRMLDMDATALQNAMADSRLPESMARTVLARLDLPGDQVFKPASVLSGGERAKVALARLMLGDYNMLVLDEPTNHLDLFTLQALEALLSGYAGTLLFVSHDRAFAEAVATRVLRFEGISLTAFEGTPSQMEREKARDRSIENRQLQITALEMRLAAIAARMAAPKKGDHPETLNEEYLRVSEELRKLKQITP